MDQAIVIDDDDVIMIEDHNGDQVVLLERGRLSCPMAKSYPSLSLILSSHMYIYAEISQQPLLSLQEPFAITRP